MIIDIAKKYNNEIEIYQDDKFYKVEGEDFNTKLVEIDVDVDKILEEYKNTEIIKDAKDNLTLLITEKRKDLKNYISGMDINTEQEEAFNFKYQLALAVKQDNDNAKEELQTEADVRGLSVENLADLIIQKHDLWINTLKSFNQKIEVFRLKINELIDQNQITKANEILIKAKDLGISTTYEDILNLFE